MDAGDEAASEKGDPQGSGKWPVRYFFASSS